ncbi:hypothetical protein WN943_013126 [Citrus x changshan-huyou]
MDWDLQAIVRGCSTEASIDSVMDKPQSYNFSPSSLQQDVRYKFPDVSETATILDELEELYKPFYPQTILTSTSISAPTEVNKKPKKLRKQQRKLSDSASNTDHPAAQPKGGKNQHKRVVQRVTADCLACDKWAWRKYGQKPIKGSPYPRSYYRCSSSKGCLARKQVERSSADPGVFIITYGAEHNHGHPTRRSALAGSTRSKLASMSKAQGPAQKEPLEPASEASAELGDLVYQGNIKKEDENAFKDGQENELVMPDLTFGDELMFPSLEDLEGFLLDQFPDHNINISADDNSWFIDESVTLNGGL